MEINVEYVRAMNRNALSQKITRYKDKNLELCKFIDGYILLDIGLVEKACMISLGLDELPGCPICGKSVNIVGMKLHITCGTPECIKEQKKSTFYDTKGGKSPDKIVKGDSILNSVRALNDVCLQDMSVILKDCCSNQVIAIGKNKDNKWFIELLKVLVPDECLTSVQRVVLIKMGLNKIPGCPHCDNKRVFDNGLLRETCCSKVCTHKQIEATLLLNTGYANPNQSPEALEKSRQTNIERRGVDNPSKCPIIKQNKINTNLERRGVDNPFKCPIVCNKIENTNIQKYGHYNPFGSSFVKDKIKKHWMNTLGVPYYIMSKEFTIKSDSTNLNTFGTYYPSQHKCVIEKATKSLKETTDKKRIERVAKSNIDISNIVDAERHRVEFTCNVCGTHNSVCGNEFNKFIRINQNPCLKCNERRIIDTKKETRTLRKTKIRENNLNIEELGFDKKGYKFICNACGNINTRCKSGFNKFIRLGIDPCPVCNPNTTGSSKQEKELLEYIRSIYSKEIIENDRTHRFEIDIYLPDLNLGIEFNGVYWHSEEHKDNDYHFNKKVLMESNGIDLIYVWEDDWNYCREIIEHRIKEKLGLIEKIKCDELREVSLEDAFDFFNTNSLDGFLDAELFIGHYNDDKLVHCTSVIQTDSKTSIIQHDNTIGLVVENPLELICTMFNEVEIDVDLDWNNSINNSYSECGMVFCDTPRPVLVERMGLNCFNSGSVRYYKK